MFDSLDITETKPYRFVPDFSASHLFPIDVEYSPDSTVMEVFEQFIVSCRKSG